MKSLLDRLSEARQMGGLVDEKHCIRLADMML